MSSRKFYGVEEDLCLGEALTCVGLTFTESGFPGLHLWIGEVHKLFVKKAAKFGIDGNRRTQRSLIDRVRILHQNFKVGTGFDESHPDTLMQRRFMIFSKIFKGSLKSQFSSGCAAGCIGEGVRHSKHVDKIDSLDSEPVIPGENLDGRIRKVRQMNTRRFMHTLSTLHKKRTEALLKREENDKLEQSVIHSERKWKRDIIKKLLKRSNADDGNFVTFLKILEDISVDDARLCMLREDRVRERIENDRETCEWEKSTFEELVEPYLD